MRNDLKTTIISIVLAIIICLVFLYCMPLGVKLNYRLQGGHAPETQTETVNLAELKRDYDKQIDNYNRYKDSTNPTQQKWAETARLKANEIATEYNQYSDTKLSIIEGE